MVAFSGIVIAVLAAGGIVGASRYVSTFWLYRGFPAPSVPHSITVRGPGGDRQVPVVPPTMQSITVPSPALGGYADPVNVVLPPGYASHPWQRYPVLYLLHGFPGGPAGFSNIGQVSTTEATLVAAGRMKPVILVMPTGTRSFLADEEWANGIRKGNAWETFVARDLVNAIDASTAARCCAWSPRCPNPRSRPPQVLGVDLSRPRDIPTASGGLRGPRRQGGFRARLGLRSGEVAALQLGVAERDRPDVPVLLSREVDRILAMPAALGFGLRHDGQPALWLTLFAIKIAIAL
jgi:putative esterase